MVVSAQLSYVDVNVSVAKQMIESDPNLTILDVRTQSEYDAGHIQNATLIPISELGGRLGELDKNKEILVYCASGDRSATASQTLVDNGFSKVYNMLGGITAWKNAGYWIEIVHNGDLIIDGTQTFVIENCTYIQTGGILVRDSGKLVVRNSQLRINQTYVWHYVFRIEDFGALKTENSVLTSDQALNFDFNEYSTADFSNVTLNLGEGSFFRFHEFSKATVHQFNVSNWHVLLFDSYSEASIINSVIYEIIVMDAACSIATSNSSIDWFSLQFGSNNAVSVDHLKPGFYELLNLQQTVIHGLPCNITLSNTYVDKWAVHSNYDSETTILDSTIARFLTFIDGYSGHISDLSPGFYEHKQVGKILLNRTDITDWVVVHIFNSTVTITNSTVILSPHSNSDVLVADSLVTLEILGDYSSGSLCFDRTTLIDRIFIFYADFFMYGNVSFENVQDIRLFSTSTKRNYNIILRYANHNPVENAELTLFNQNHTFVWDGVTDSLGQADFNLTFSDSNYTDTLRLEAVKENLSAVASISFLSDTPVTLTLGAHDVATNDVAPSKTVVGQGFTLPVNVTVMNKGDFAENFNVTSYTNATSIGTRTVFNLSNGTSATLTFNWDTTGLAYGNYIVSSYAWPVQGETDVADNNFTGGVVTVTIPGDINGDCTVDIYDALTLAGAYNSRPNTSNWNINADINSDNIVDIYDAIILAGNFGKTA
jgi:rhodanese-related sulfurtransferase